MLEPRPWRRPMLARSHAEAHRQASWLELLFDLSFVVAVAQASVQLEHSLAEGHVGDGLTGFLVVFAAIWWAWMAFTWFANVFDTDDVPYRLLMFVMIAGSLGLAAGVPQIAHMDFRIGVLSYVVMRLAYVSQWFRVWLNGEPVWRPVAMRIMVLTTINQAGWVLFLWVPPDWKLQAFVAWFAADIATPYVAGWDARTGGHRHHIVERYGLFTIIVLGEAVAASTVAVGKAIDAQAEALPLLFIAIGGFVTVCSLWWMYFDFSASRAPALSRASQYLWGYLHYFLFAGVAATGAGIVLALSWTTDPAHIALTERGVTLVTGGAIAIVLLTIALIEGIAERALKKRDALLKLGCAALVIGAALAAPAVSVSGSILLMGLALAAVVAYGVTLQHMAYRAAS